MIEPIALEKIVIETNCINPSRIKIRPFCDHSDPQPKFLTEVFRREMRDNRLGGQLYEKSLVNLLLIHLLRHYLIQQRIKRAK